jgi:predicted 2-oxoglutarate/Fe(II)-dependent dioxygenase YbiX
MGIRDDNDRDAILKEILKQQLKADIMEIKELENLNNVYENCLQESK